MANKFQDVLDAAIADIGRHGYDDPQRIARWAEELRRAAQAQRTFTKAYLDTLVRNALGSIYTRLADKGGVFKYHPGVERFTVERIRPALRAQLDLRIMASANLIRLNRTEAINKTLQRFEGWSTSIPNGGSGTISKRAVKRDLKKPLASLPFVDRRVLIDQGHKLVSAINQTVAEGANAIALRWHSNWRQPNYNYRPDHKERDDQVYLIRDSWARERGLIKPGDAGYYDQVTAVGEEPFCRCYATYLYNLRDLPQDMLTKAGAEALNKVRVSA